jgi:hypothetical protein
LSIYPKHATKACERTRNIKNIREEYHEST